MAKNRKKSAILRKDGRWLSFAVFSSGRKAVYVKSGDEAVEAAVRLEQEEKDFIEREKYTYLKRYRKRHKKLY